jgi:hypothetical protein
MMKQSEAVQRNITTKVKSTNLLLSPNLHMFHGNVGGNNLILNGGARLSAT